MTVCEGAAGRSRSRNAGMVCVQPVSFYEGAKEKGKRGRESRSRIAREKGSEEEGPTTKISQRWR